MAGRTAVSSLRVRQPEPAVEEQGLTLDIPSEVIRFAPETHVIDLEIQTPLWRTGGAVGRLRGNYLEGRTSRVDDEAAWRVEQMLVDAQDLNDWVAEFEVVLAASREAGEPFLRLRRLQSLV